MSEIQKFDPSTLMQGVKDRIKATFVSLIPDDQWEQMVKAEVDRFFNDTSDTYHNRNREVVPSPFKMLVMQVITDEAKARLKKYLLSDEFNGIWTQNGEVAASSAVESMIVQNSGEILKAVLGSVLQSAIDRMKHNM